MDSVTLNKDLTETAAILEEQADLLDVEVVTLNETHIDWKTEKGRLTQSYEDLKDIQVD